MKSLNWRIFEPFDPIRCIPQEANIAYVQLLKLNTWLVDVIAKIDAKPRDATGQLLAEDFKRKGEVYTGVSGGNLTLSVTPTSLGTVFKVKESITGEEIDLTGYEEW